VFTHCPEVPSATVMVRVQVASTVGPRALGVNCCVRAFHTPGSGLPEAEVTVQVSTSKPEKLAWVQPRPTPEIMVSTASVPVKLPPLIE